MNIIASVLHLGNVQYGEDESNACITSDTQIKYLSRVRKWKKASTRAKNLNNYQWRMAQHGHVDAAERLRVLLDARFHW